MQTELQLRKAINIVCCFLNNLKNFRVLVFTYIINIKAILLVTNGIQFPEIILMSYIKLLNQFTGSMLQRFPHLVNAQLVFTYGCISSFPHITDNITVDSTVSTQNADKNCK